ncbi:cyclase/dehydrase [Nitzschia inconspicua]|uniref:Cyclase/dehydrase n=1 Tax=Nitzschia inconspicua TaxID=303405 RepID=A0A9K3PU78_9STRA|nr:cyclase/dehydrase [Nitzschia inconspicua]
MNNPFHNNPDIPQRRLIEVSSRIELPFSVYDAYDAYADLPRQPTWSSWLDSVVIKTDNPNESVWTMKFLGIRYSWTAVAVQNKRPHIIQWKSITGLQNFGTVRFYEKDDDNTSFMTMSMTFVAPRAVSLAFQKSKALAKYVEQKMITQSLEEFRNIVSHEVNSKQRNLTSVGEE